MSGPVVKVTVVGLGGFTPLQGCRANSPIAASQLVRSDEFFHTAVSGEDNDVVTFRPGAERLATAAVGAGGVFIGFGWAADEEVALDCGRPFGFVVRDGEDWGVAVFECFDSLELGIAAWVDGGFARYGFGECPEIEMRVGPGVALPGDRAPH